MEIIKNQGLIRFKYENELTKYISDFILHEIDTFGIYFRENQVYYTIIYNFFNNQSFYLFDPISKLDDVLVTVGKAYFYPIEDEEFLSHCEYILNEEINKKEEFTNYNFSRSLINKILDSYQEYDLPTKIFYFKLYSINIKSTFERAKRIGKRNVDLKRFEIKSEINQFYDHEIYRQNTMQKLNELYFNDKKLYMILMHNMLVNNHYHIIEEELYSNLNSIRSETVKIYEQLKKGHIFASSLKSLFDKMNSFCDYYYAQKLKHIKKDLYTKSLNNHDNIESFNSIHLTDQILFDENLFNFDYNKDELKAILKYINSIYKFYPTNQILIGLQNELVQRLSSDI